MDPTDLYYKLANIADHVLQGATVKDGDTLSFEQGQPPLTVQKEPWYVDESYPAVTINFSSSSALLPGIRIAADGCKHRTREVVPH